MTPSDPKLRSFFASRDRQADTWRWLEANGPREWHLLVQHYNWDDGAAPLWWIATHERCDAGTAADIFLLADPYDTVALEKWAETTAADGFERDVWELLLAISDRWRGNQYLGWKYKSSQLTADGRTLLKSSIEAQRSRSTVTLIIPETMAEPNESAEVVAIDDYPGPFADYFWNLISSTWLDGSLGAPVAADRKPD